jgi:hypothetical protein
MWGRRAAAVALAAVSVIGTAVPGEASTTSAEADPGTITVRPSGDLVDGQEVLVHGEDWPERFFLVVAQCDARVDSFGGCDESNAQFVEGSTTEFTVRIELDRAIDTVRFGRLDCASAPGACVIAVFYRPGNMLTSARLRFDPNGPPPPPEPQLDIDVAATAKLRPDGDGARIDVRLTCMPGMHVFTFVEIIQDQGEDDAVGFAEVFVERCRGTVTVPLEVRAVEGRFTPGSALAFGDAFGFRQGDDDEGVGDSEFAEITLVG